jgi:hypothetical protein
LAVNLLCFSQGLTAGAGFALTSDMFRYLRTSLSARGIASCLAMTPDAIACNNGIFNITELTFACAAGV